MHKYWGSPTGISGIYLCVQVNPLADSGLLKTNPHPSRLCHVCACQRHFPSDIPKLDLMIPVGSFQLSNLWFSVDQSCVRLSGCHALVSEEKRSSVALGEPHPWEIVLAPGWWWLTYNQPPLWTRWDISNFCMHCLHAKEFVQQAASSSECFWGATSNEGIAFSIDLAG